MDSQGTAGRSIEQEGRTLVERLGGDWGASGGVCRCPAHDDRRPSLSVRPGRSRLLLHCFAGCSAEAILSALQSDGLIAPGKAESRRAESGSDQNHLGTAARRIWTDSRSLAGTPAEVYLAQRGLRTGSPELRFNPRTPHGRQPLTRYRPALIAAVRDEAGLTGVHRTFLDPPPPYSAPPHCEKHGLGRFGRGAVRLGGAAPRLGLAEGLETALSATALFDVPCWATLGTERFALVAPPSEARELLLFLDHDAGGRRAEALARGAFGHLLHVEAHYPDRPGDDWNDVLRATLRAASNGRGEEARES